jgi:hypothetical protein
MMIEILKGKDYTPHRTGWVVLVDGQPHHRDTKREAEELKQRLLDFEASRKLEALRVLHRARHLELGKALKRLYPSFRWEWVPEPMLWLTREPAECAHLKGLLRGADGWRALLDQPGLIPLLHDCESWAGFTLD